MNEPKQIEAVAKRLRTIDSSNDPALGPDADLVHVWISSQNSPNTKWAYLKDAAGRFLTYFAKPLGQITLANLLAFREELSAGDLAPRTQNRILTAIKSLLTFGQETGYLQFNVGVALKLRSARDNLVERILEETEVSQLINSAAGRDQMILRLLYASGLRVSEICALKWTDAIGRGDKGGQITVFGKGGKTRTILLKPKTWARLMALRGGAGNLDPIFRSRKKGGHLAESQVRRIVYGAARRAGLAQNVSPHWMRHSHASHALDHGAPIHSCRTPWDILRSQPQENTFMSGPMSPRVCFCQTSAACLRVEATGKNY